MKKIMIAILVATFAFAGYATERKFSLEGKYMYLGDGIVHDRVNANAVFFPSSLRDTERRESNPWTTQLLKNTDVIIEDKGASLEITRTEVFGAPFGIVEQFPRITKSLVVLKANSGERISINNDEQTITFSRLDGILIAGQKVKVTIQKLENGDLLVNDVRTGWAPIPTPVPVVEKSEYLLRKQ